MSEKTPKSLSELMFRPGSGVAELVRRAEESLSLLALLKAGLEPAPAEALRTARLDADGTLVVAVSSPAWAARLRFDAERLRALCRERHPACKRVEVRVASPDVPGGVTESRD